eukprot:m.79491 g.79491  ORF g.79491 m.79491 type:complete len:320 (+) comp8605_c2_seq1:66-1025(+)
MSMNGVLAVLLVLALAANSVHGWGVFGHETVAEVAQSLLSEGTNAIVTKVLQGVTMKSVATWADAVRLLPGWEWSFPLHFVDTKDRACDYEYKRDCQFEGEPNRCVVASIANYSQQAAPSFANVYPNVFNKVVDEITEVDPPPTNLSAQNMAVRFLTHFLGDIHQPLHTGFVGDEGGNLINVTFFGEAINLHSVWDDGMINRTIKNEYGGNVDSWSKDLQERIKVGEYKHLIPQWQKCLNGDDINCVGTFAEEGVELACTNAYECMDKTCSREGVVENPNLGEKYYEVNMKIVNYRIAQAAVRLAGVFETIFGGKQRAL